jgi:Asp-tRNA(Asn)/Glu-tRNA(Gln) amidotransferase A subunit family amidase
MLVGRHFEEATLIRLAGAVEATGAGKLNKDAKP